MEVWRVLCSWNMWDSLGELKKRALEDPPRGARRGWDAGDMVMCEAGENVEHVVADGDHGSTDSQCESH